MNTTAPANNCTATTANNTATLNEIAQMIDDYLTSFVPSGSIQLQLWALTARLRRYTPINPIRAQLNKIHDNTIIPNAIAKAVKMNNRQNVLEIIQLLEEITDQGNFMIGIDIDRLEDIKNEYSCAREAIDRFDDKYAHLMHNDPYDRVACPFHQIVSAYASAIQTEEEEPFYGLDWLESLETAWHKGNEEIIKVALAYLFDAPAFDNEQCEEFRQLFTVYMDEIIMPH